MTNNQTIETPLGVISSEAITALVKSIHKAWGDSEDEYSRSHHDKVEFLGTDCLIDESEKEHIGASGKILFYSVHKLIETKFDTVSSTRYNQLGAKLPLVNKSVKIGPGEEAEIPFNGWFHIVHKENFREFVIHLYTGYHGELNVSVSCDGSEGDAKDFHDWTDEWFYNEGPIKGAVVNADLDFIEVNPQYSIDDVILDSKVSSSLNLHVFSFLENIETFTKLGLTSSRGILMAGPPGTGKTSFCRAVLNNRHDATAFYITSDDVSTAGKITEIYSHARAFSPSIVIIEDIDTLGGLDRRVGSNPLLGELLNALDGAVTNKGVITIATSNHVNHLDEALRNRPGRFDAIIEVGLPSKSCLAELILNSALSHGLVINFDINSIAKKMVGLTGAWVKELLTHATLIRLNDGCEPEKISLDNKTIKLALADILSRAAIAAAPPEHSATIGVESIQKDGFRLYS